MKRSVILALAIAVALASLAAISVAGWRTETSNTAITEFTPGTNPPPGNDPCAPWRYRGPAYMLNQINGQDSKAALSLYPFIATSYTQFNLVSPQDISSAGGIVLAAVKAWPTDHTSTQSQQVLTANYLIDAWASQHCDLSQRIP